MFWPSVASLLIMTEEAMISSPISTAPGASTEGALPQAAPPDPDAPVWLGELEVKGRRGAALVDAEIELDEAAIDALGAYDIGEAVQRLTEDYALGEAPMIIVNGRRMADPNVFSGFPPDALMRLEVLPPQAGALYGAIDPSRRVVNIVLQRRFHSRDGRASVKRPTAGGMTNTAANLRQSSILDARTRHLSLEVGADTALRAGERDQDRENGPDVDKITLRSPSESIAVNVTQTGVIGDWSASLNANARAQETRSISLRGGEAVESRRRSQAVAMTAGFGGDVAGWSSQLTLNGALSHGEQSGLSRADTRQQAISASLGLNRPLLDLPAGAMAASLSARLSGSRSISERPEGRQTFSGRARDLAGSLSIPLSRRGAGGDRAFGALGELSMTLGGNMSDADAGSGEGFNAGLAWSPLSKIRVNASWSTATQSVSDQQRFDPQHYGEPTVVFDFRRGEAVEVLPIFGGNPDLRQPRADLFSLSASGGPFTTWALQGSLNYHRGEIVDGIGALPDPTPEVEAAFPDRFHRDADGRLISVDRRAINFGSGLTETLTTNLGATFPWSSSEDGAGRGVVRVSINHNWQLTNRTTFHAALPVMDRLSGDGGGVPRHQVGLSVDVRRGQWGLNSAARWRDGYRVRRDSGRDGTGDLRIKAFKAVDLKITYQFARNLPTQESAGGARRGTGLQVELEVSNLFDARPDARLDDGRAAPGYGRDDQDPVGRTVSLTLRRRF